MNLCYNDLDLCGYVIKIEVLKHEQELGVDVVEEGEVAKHGGDGVHAYNQKQRRENDFHHFSFRLNRKSELYSSDDFNLSSKVAVDGEHGAVAFEREEKSWERIDCLSVVLVELNAITFIVSHQDWVEMDKLCILVHLQGNVCILDLYLVIRFK